jgi:3-phytase
MNPINNIRNVLACAAVMVFITFHAAPAAADDKPGEAVVIHPRPAGVTAPIPVEQVEDAAIWIHPADPAQSLVFVSHKKQGLAAHRPDGLILKHYDDGVAYAGLDVAYNVPLGAGKADVVIGACETEKSAGLRFWAIDPAKGKLSPINSGDLTPVLEGKAGLGICEYRSLKTGKQYVFVSSDTGRIEQYELSPTTAPDRLDVKRVRSLKLPGKVKGIVADDENGALYAAQEKAGVFKFPAEPEKSLVDAELAIPVNDHGMVPDLTGLALYTASNGRGYLLVVSQGVKGSTSTVGIFNRQPPHDYLATIVPPTDGDIHAPAGASGIIVTNRPMGPAFAHGLFGLKDRLNANGIENYKLFSWDQIAQLANLQTDTTTSPRH